jgi:hypothetical protein
MYRSQVKHKGRQLEENKFNLSEIKTVGKNKDEKLKVEENERFKRESFGQGMACE